MSDIDFQPWPKIARLNRNIVITEKIDGTNAAVVIVQVAFGEGVYPDHNRIAIIVDDSRRDESGMPDYEYHVYAQSRSRFITPEQDNYGFARWVEENAEGLVLTLGEGIHFGERWGSGIQRKYGLTGSDKRFWLFNAKRWQGLDCSAVPGLGVVPVLYEGPFSESAIKSAVDKLHAFGSAAAPGFMRPEGIVIFHTASRESYKVTLEGDEAPKGAAGHANDEERAA